MLYGDPAKAGLFAIRLKLPKGYHIPPHTHPKPEVVTIVSGAARLGTGETANEKKTESVTAGGFRQPSVEELAQEPDGAEAVIALGLTVLVFAPFLASEAMVGPSPPGGCRFEPCRAHHFPEADGAPSQSPAAPTLML